MRIVRALGSRKTKPNKANFEVAVRASGSRPAGAGTTRGNIVLITDGAANMQTERLPGLIHQAKASGVRIFTIGVGNNGDGDYDRTLLIRMARSTGGRFMSAHSFKALCNALRRAC